MAKEQPKPADWTIFGQEVRQSTSSNLNVLLNDSYIH